jgi:hypothetical protein
MLSGNTDPLSRTFSHFSSCKPPYVVISSRHLAQHKYAVQSSSLTITKGKSPSLSVNPVLSVINSTLIIVKWAFYQLSQLIH